jgi:aryl-alcohol dehydrogenase-like predicted oxidoreductase
MGALGELKEQGKIRRVGLLNFSVELCEAALRRGSVGIIQLPFSI